MELNLLFSIFVVISLVITYFAGKFIPVFLLTLIPVLLISPFLAGITFIARNYARQEHAFLTSDFFDAVKQNWKAFLTNGAVCYFLYFVLSISIRFYYNHSSDGILYTAAFCLCIAIALLLLFAQYYVPLMIVTFDLKLAQIYKNALIFAILGLWRNLLLTILLATIGFGLYLSQVMPLSLLLAILFAATLLFSLSSFMVNFTIYPLVDQMMIQPYQKNHPEAPQQEEENTMDFKDK